MNRVNLNSRRSERREIFEQLEDLHTVSLWTERQLQIHREETQDHPALSGEAWSLGPWGLLPEDF